MQERIRAADEGPSLLHTAGSLLVLSGVAYRLMFSASIAGFFGNALADMAFFAAVTVLLVASVRRDGVRLRATAAWAALALYAVACVIATKTSANPRAAVEPLTNLAALVCLFLAVSGGTCGEAGAPRAAAYLVSLAAIPIVVAFYQYFYEFPQILKEGVTLPGMVGGVYVDERSAADFRTRIETMRAFATFLTPNVLAGVLALVLPVTLAVGVAALVSAAKPATKILAASAAGAMAAVEAALLLVTKSKAGVAAAALAVGIFAVLALRKLLGRKAFLSLAAAGMIVVAAGVAANLPRAKQYYEEALTSLDVRIGYWQTTWSMICAEPLSGAGAGNFGEAYVMVKGVGAREVRDPHNWALMAWAEGGLFALVFLLAFCALVFVGKRDTSDRRPGPGAGMAAAAIVGALLFYAVTQADFAGVNQGMTATVVAGAAAAVVLAIIFLPAASASDPALVRAGLAAGVVGILAHGLTDVDMSDAGAATAAVFAAAALSPRGWSVSVGERTGRAAALAVLAAVALVLFVWRALVPLSQAEFAMRDAVELVERGQFQASANRAQEALVLDPGDPSVSTFLGRLYAISPEARVPSSPYFGAAEGFFKRALSLDATYRPAHEGLARLYASAGAECRDRAIEQYKILLVLYPTNSYYHVAAGRLLEQAGRLDEALDSYRTAIEIDDWTEEHGQQFTREERLGLRADVERLKKLIKESSRG